MLLFFTVSQCLCLAVSQTLALANALAVTEVCTAVQRACGYWLFAVRRVLGIKVPSVLHTPTCLCMLIVLCSRLRERKNLMTVMLAGVGIKLQ